MAKKAELQEKAKNLEGYKDSLTIAELEDLIEKSKNSNKSEDLEKTEQSTESEESEETEESQDGEGKGEPEFSTFKSNRLIKAQKIESIIRKRGGAKLILEGDYNDVDVDSHYMKKYDPRAGNYFVTCEEGCKKYITAKELERDFEEVESTE